MTGRFSSSRIIHSPAAAAVCSLAALVSSPSAAEVQQPAGVVSRIREVPVTAEQLPGLLTPRWRPVPWEEYQELRKLAGEHPQQAWISRADYTATFDGTTLSSGTLRAEVKYRRRGPVLVSLEPLNLAVSELEWEDRAAVWGSTRRGRMALRVDGRQSQLKGRWTRRGRPTPYSVEFDLRLLPATVSNLQLLVPQEYAVSSSAGRVLLLKPPGEPGFNRWSVELGHHNLCRLSITAPAPAADASPRILAEKESLYVLHDDGLRLETKFSLEVLDAPVERLDFELPADVEVEEVVLGTATRLASSLLDEKGTRILRVALPDPLLGRSRPLRILAYTPIQRGRRWRLPRVDLRGGSFLSGVVSLTVGPRLQLQSIEPGGLRQTDISFESTRGETRSFQQYLPDARLTIVAGQPRSRVTSQGLTFLDLSQESIELTSEFHWTAVEGTTFEAACTVAPGWEVTSVQIVQSASAAFEANWSLEHDAQNRGHLRVEFGESLDADHPRTVRIHARRAGVLVEEELEMPAVAVDSGTAGGHWLAILHTPTIEPVLSPGSTVTATAGEGLPAALRRLPLWSEIAPRSQPPSEFQLLRASQLAETLKLRSGEQAAGAEANVSVEIHPERMTETFTLSVEPRVSKLDRMIVLLTGEDDGSGNPRTPDWEFIDAAGNRMTLSSRAAEAAHAPAGRAWEIVFPEPQTEPFQIRASTSRPRETVYEPRLLFVPGAARFQGRLRVDRKDPGVLEVLRSTLPGPSSGGRKETGDTSWQYQTPDDRITFRIPPVAGNEQVLPVGSLHLRSMITPAGGAYDIHTATYRLKSADPVKSLQFKLPLPAILSSATTNGSAASLRRDGATCTFSNPLPAGENRIELRYRSPSRGLFLQDARRVMVPRIACDVLSFHWDIALPPGVTPAAAPESMLLEKPPEICSWRHRFFGPLGQPAAMRTFDSSRIWPSGDDAAQSQRAVFRAAAPALPDEAAVTLVSRSRLNLLGWMALLASLLAGLSLRRLNVAHRQTVALAWLAAALAACSLLPIVYAFVCGGSLAGTLLAILMPRKIVQLRFLPQSRRELGSTATYRHVPSTAAYLIFALLSLPLAAQVTSEPPPNGSRPRDNGAPAPVVDEFTVLIPDSAAPPAVVYLQAGLRETLGRLAGDKTPADDMLISSADYRVQIDSRNHSQIEARYRIALPDGSSATQVFLPITSANPGGDTPCLVDGQPRPLLLSPEGDGFLIEIPPQTPAPVEAPKPRSPDDHYRGKTFYSTGSARMIDVQLQLFPPTTSDMAGGRLEIGIPPVAATRVSVQHENAAAGVAIAEAQGGSDGTSNTGSIAAWLGRSDRLKINWSTQAQQNSPPAELGADVICLVDVQPTRLEYRYQILCNTISGRPQFLLWTLPEEVVVRSLESEAVSGWVRLPAGHRRQNLFVELSPEAPPRFVISAAMTLPVSAPAETITVPSLAAFDRGSETDTAVTISGHLLGVRAAPGFELTPRAVNGEGAGTIAVESFGISSAGDDRPFLLGRPQFAYRLDSPAELPFALSPVAVRRKVSNRRLTGHIHGTKIDWTLTADVQVTTPGGGAFTHRLFVDPRLTIESAGVREDDVNRLVRHTTDGPVATLILSEKTAGTQNVTLRAGQPVQFGRAVTVPDIHFLDAEPESTEIVLYRDPEISVALTTAETRIPDNGRDELLSETDTGIYAGRYRFSAGETLPELTTSRRVNRTVFDQASIVTPLEEGAWELSSVFRLPPLEAEAPARFAIHVPPEAPEIVDIFHSAGRLIRRSRGDGSTGIALDTEPADSGPVSLTIVTRLEAASPESTDRRLPLISAVEANRRSHFLILDPRMGFAPAAEIRFAPLEKTELPRWLRDAAERQAPGNEFNVYRGQPETWRLVRLDDAPSKEAATVRLLNHLVVLGGASGEFGRSELVLAPGAGRRLELDWPANTRLRTLLVDGEPAGVDAPEEGVLSIPLAAKPDAQRIDIFWKRPGAALPPFLGVMTMEVPRLRNVRIERSLFAMLAPESRGLFRPPADTRKLSAAEYDEMISEIAETTPSPPESTDETPPEETSPDVFAPGQLPASSADRLDLLENLDRNDGKDAGQLVMYHRGLIRVLIVAGMLLAGFLILKRFSPAQLGAFLDRHAEAAWMLAGLGWWLWLQPAWLGMVISAAGLLARGYRFLRAQRRIEIQPVSDH